MLFKLNRNLTLKLILIGINNKEKRKRKKKLIKNWKKETKYSNQKILNQKNSKLRKIEKKSQSNCNKDCENETSYLY